MLLEVMDDTDSSDSSVSCSSSMIVAASSLSAKPKPFSQGQLNDFVHDLGLSKESSEILASRLHEHSILDSESKITFYHDRDNSFSHYGRFQGLLSKMGRPEYNPNEWRLFIDSSKRSLKCVLLYIGNKFACFPIGYSVIVKEHYLNVKMVLQKLRYSEPNWAICVDQWFSNCASRRPGASFQFSKNIAEYFGFVPLSLGFIASKEL